MLGRLVVTCQLGRVFRQCSSSSRTVVKSPKRKATSLLNELKKEEFQTLKNGREWEQIQSGDSIVVERLPFATSNQIELLKGVVISRVNRASDSAITMINVEHGTPIVRRIVLYNPLIKSVKVLQKAFIHNGKKRVRRSKLYYLLDRDPDCYTVK